MAGPPPPRPWLGFCRAGPHLIPIPGTRSAAHLTQFAQGTALTLTADDLAEIDRLLPAGFAAGDRYGDHQLMAIERYC